MAVTLDAVAADAVNYTSSSNSITSFTVGSGSNRFLLVTLQIDPTMTGVAVHWDTAGTNQAMTLIGSSTDPENHGTVYMYGLVAPTSGNKTLTATWTGSSSSAMMAPISFTGVNQTGGTSTWAHVATASTTGAVTGTVTSATGNYVVGSFVINATIASVNNTQWFIDNGGANDGGAGNYATGASTVTLTSSPTSGTDGFSFVGVDIAASGGLSGTVGDSSASSDSLTAHMVVAATQGDSSASSDSLSAHMVVVATQGDSSASSDSLSMVLVASVGDSSASSDSLTGHMVVTTSAGDTTASSDSLSLTATLAATVGDSAASSDGLTAGSGPSILPTTEGDGVTSGDSLSASVSGFYVEKLLKDTATTSDTLALVAGLVSTITDTDGTSDTVTLTSISGSSVIKPDGDSATTGDSLGLSMTVHLTISDGAVTSDLVSKPLIPKGKRTDQLTTASTRLVPIIPGGAAPYAQQQIQDLQTMAKNLLAMVPQAATQAPDVPVDGMVRLSRNPWHPVSDQTVDAWVYYDGAAGLWVYQTTPPVTT